jgi:hypothetical protein
MGKDPFIITEETGKLIKEWCESGVDEVQDAINKLAKCNNLDELRLLKETLSQSTIKDKRFIEAAKQRYEDVK